MKDEKLLAMQAERKKYYWPPKPGVRKIKTSAPKPAKVITMVKKEKPQINWLKVKAWSRR